jgi:hypothetical protein
MSSKKHFSKNFYVEKKYSNKKKGKKREILNPCVTVTGKHCT